MLAASRYYGGAIAEYRKSLALERYDTLAHYSLGQALAGMGRKQEAAKEFAIAKRLDPSLNPSLN
jgi:tetratricopeptide (TPR) repeat protein